VPAPAGNPPAAAPPRWARRSCRTPTSRWPTGSRPPPRRPSKPNKPPAARPPGGRRSRSWPRPASSTRPSPATTASGPTRSPSSATPKNSIEALEQYVRLVPNDDVARLRLIEHYSAGYQTTDARLKYLRFLLDQPSVSNEIKSRCATWAAVLLGERSRQQQVEMLARAVELDPVNIYARRLEYALLTSGGAGPAERVASLAAQLRCNPAQVRVLASIGRELAAAGLTRESLNWMVAARNLSDRAGEPIDADYYVEYVAQLHLGGLAAEAEQTLGQVLEQDPTNIDAWFLRLTLRRAAGLQVAYEQDMDQAKRLFAGRAGELARRVRDEGDPAAAAPASKPAAGGGAGAGGDGAAGAAAGGPAGIAQAAPVGQVLADTVARLKRPDASPFYRSEFVSAMADLAWLELYHFRSESGAKPWVDALGQLLPADDLTVVRLRGWLELVGNRPDAARPLLARSPTATRWPGWARSRSRRPSRPRPPRRLRSPRRSRPMPPLGPPPGPRRSRRQPQRRPRRPTRRRRPRPLSEADQLAQALLDRHPAGLLGAMLAVEFKDRGLVARPGPQADAMKQAVARFPIELVRVVDQPGQFYAPVGEATKVPYRLGDPMIARVTLQNRSNYDLPIGPDGVIKPDLWFDARVSHGQDRPSPMIWHDRISGGLVLKARSSLVQHVRVDQGELAAAIRERPAGSVDVNVTVMTNPQLLPDFKVVAGPGGVRRHFVRSLIRAGAPIGNEVQLKKLRDGLDGLPNEKMAALDAMAALVGQARGPDAEPKVEFHAKEFLEQIAQARRDRVPHVAAWAAYVTAKLAVDEAAARAAAAAASRPTPRPTRGWSTPCRRWPGPPGGRAGCWPSPRPPS
jgi:tetratricopeptide (TPR) repeat protein